MSASTEALRAALAKALEAAARVAKTASMVGLHARRVTRRAHISVREIERIADALDARGHDRDLANDLRTEAGKLRNATNEARHALG